jgi:hypothetical protein
LKNAILNSLFFFKIITYKMAYMLEFFKGVLSEYL